MSLISTSERRDIEDYLNLYCIEACMDEVLNEIVEKRPVNPYMVSTSLRMCVWRKSIELYYFIAGDCGSHGSEDNG
jgi:hypothetical protein